MVVRAAFSCTVLYKNKRQTHAGKCNATRFRRAVTRGMNVMSNARPEKAGSFHSALCGVCYSPCGEVRTFDGLFVMPERTACGKQLETVRGRTVLRWRS